MKVGGEQNKIHVLLARAIISLPRWWPNWPLSSLKGLADIILSFWKNLSNLPEFPGPEVKVKVTQLCLTLCNPMDYTVHGILQARILEYSFPSPVDLPNPGIEPKSPALQADSLPAEPQGNPPGPSKGQNQDSNPGKRDSNMVFAASASFLHPVSSFRAGIIDKIARWTAFLPSNLFFSFSLFENGFMSLLLVDFFELGASYFFMINQLLSS